MEPILIEEPIKSYGLLLALLFITLGIGTFVALVYYNKIGKMSKPYQQMLVMVGGLLALMFLGTTILTTWHLSRIQPIILYDEYIDCYQGRINYKDIKRAGIYTDSQVSMMNPKLVSGKTKMLVIERKNKKVAVFSEDYYDVEKLVRQIKGQMK